jgi:hypothetical protein
MQKFRKKRILLRRINRKNEKELRKKTTAKSRNKKS